MQHICHRKTQQHAASQRSPLPVRAQCAKPSRRRRGQGSMRSAAVLRLRVQHVAIVVLAGMTMMLCMMLSLTWRQGRPHTLVSLHAQPYNCSSCCSSVLKEQMTLPEAADNVCGAGTLLYNGLCISSVFPPPSQVYPIDFLPRPPWARARPPAAPQYNHGLSQHAVDVTVGRQLFVDDFLIQSTTCERVFHQARFLGPVFPEQGPDEDIPAGREYISIRTFKGGVWYTRETGWGMIVECNRAVASRTCLSRSQDGVTWQPLRVVSTGIDAVSTDRVTMLPNIPALPARPGALVSGYRFLGVRATHMHVTRDPALRSSQPFWLLHHPVAASVQLIWSDDGVSWTVLPEEQATLGLAADADSVSWDPFRQVYTLSLRENVAMMRIIRRVDLDASWGDAPLTTPLPMWTRADGCSEMVDADTPVNNQCRNAYLGTAPVPWSAAFPGDADLWDAAYAAVDEPVDPHSRTTDVYTVTTFAYESVTVALQALHLGGNSWPKKVETHALYSRDTFHLAPSSDRSVALATFASVSAPEPPSAGRGPRWLQVICTASNVVVRDEDITLLCDGVPVNPEPVKGPPYVANVIKYQLRRDGFASMWNQHKQGCRITTVPVRFRRGSHVYINADQPGVRVSLLVDGKPVLGPSQPTPHAGTKVATSLNVAAYAGQIVQLVFQLPSSARLYAFWVSDADGRSGGAIPGAGSRATCGLDIESFV